MESKFVMVSFALAGWLLVMLNGTSLAAQNLPGLRMHESGTYLETETGRPFFYLGDTAWEMLHRLDKPAVQHYLSSRAEQGFNVVQTVILAELDGLKTPNANGDLPLLDQDPTQPNEAYFEHVDYALKFADEQGIYLGLLPTWGDKFNLKWGVGPEIFTPANAEAYGAYLARRYRDRKNIIWILGGDRNPEEAEDFAIIRAMAKGLRSEMGTPQLITYHPQGGSSSADFFVDDDWIDFHLYQTGHGQLHDKANYDVPREFLRDHPQKTIINGEPAYEDHPVNWRPANGWFDDWDSRQAAYWSVFNGTKGHVFGNHNTWQMWWPDKEPISVARTPWRSALYYPGAWQIGYLGKLMQSEFHQLSPRPDLLPKAPNSSGREQFCLARAVPNVKDYMATLLVYTPYGDLIEIDEDKLGWKGADHPYSARWFDPRTGRYFLATRQSGGGWRFDPPFTPGRGNDWVLVLTAG